MTDEPLHTDGPWRIAQGGRYQAQFRAICPVGDDGEIDPQREVCRLWSRSKNTLAEMEANARLIAAAPDLFSTLCRIEWQIREKGEREGDRKLLDLADSALRRIQVAAPELFDEPDKETSS